MVASPSSNEDDDAVRQARTSGGERPGASVARQLSELARELQAEPDFSAVMDRIVMAAVNELAGATAVAITLVQHGQVSSPAHSSELAERVGTIQSETGEGPCVDSSRQEVTIRVDDLRDSSPWPKFAARAVEMGISSLLSFQLFVGEDSMGALDVYSDRVGGFDSQDEETGLLLASHAAIAMGASQEITTLRVAMDTRDLIGQAKGILMERYKIDGGRAFDVLVMSSQHTNQKLRDVAWHLATAGELPGLAQSTPGD
jgi:transcriptional regulator with GAF, ATPase, and Fis domain